MSIGCGLLLALLAAGVAALGLLSRRLRTRDLPEVSDREFFEELIRRYPIMASPEAVSKERGRIAGILGIAPEKPTLDQTSDFLSKRLEHMADFSVAWNDLLDEASEAREAAGLNQRTEPPETIGDLIEDLLRDPR